MSLSVAVSTNVTPVVGGPAPDAYRVLFVDSVNGSDANDGEELSTPFRTLARAAQESLGEGSYVLLARGSRFREELSGWPVGVRIRAYGYGDRPIIDGRDIANNGAFSKTAGRTNVYQIAWSHSFGQDGGKSRHRVWENDAMMTRAASLAACDSTPGSFYADDPTSGGPDLVYVHPANSTNPTGNGRQYQLTKRRWAIQLYIQYNQGHVTSLEAIGNSYADGALCVDGYAEDCIARDGRVHNAFILGTAVDCQAIRCEPGVQSTMYVSYIASVFGGGPSARNVIYRRCTADPERVAVEVTGWYVHTNGDGRNFGTIEYDSCHAVDCQAAWSGLQLDRVVHYKCTYENVPQAYGYGENCLILGGSGRLREGAVENCCVSWNGNGKQLIVHGLKTYHPGGALGPIVIDGPNSTITIERCTIAHGSGGWSQFKGGNITYNRVVSAYGNTVHVGIGKASVMIAAYSADRNVYWSGTGTMTGHNTVTNQFPNPLSAWRSLLNSLAIGTGRDELSIEANPQIADAAGLDFTIGNTTVLALGAGAEVDEEDDPELQAYYQQYRVTEV